LKNPLSPFFLWVYTRAHFILYEECDDTRVPGNQLRVKRIIHNILLIEAWAASTIVIGLPVAVLIFLLLFSVPYAFLVYATVTISLGLFFHLGRKYEKMKEEDYMKTLRSGRDSYTEAMS
jgi:hypothetical protein